MQDCDKWTSMQWWSMPQNSHGCRKFPLWKPCLTILLCSSQCVYLNLWAAFSMHTILCRHIPSHAWPPFYMILSCFPLNVKLFPVHFNNIFSMPLIFFLSNLIPSDSLAALPVTSFLLITSPLKERKKTSSGFHYFLLFHFEFPTPSKKCGDCCSQDASRWQREK